MLFLESFRFKQIAEAVEQCSYDEGICVDLNLIEALFSFGVVRHQNVTGDLYVDFDDL